MKTKKLRLIALVAILGVGLVNCDDSEIAQASNEIPLTENETLTLLESDDISDELDNVVDDYLYGDIQLSSKESLSSKDDGKDKGRVPDCATKSVETEGDIKTVTLDFGEGCELRNENVLSGKIIITHNKNIETETLIVTKTFEAFFFNDVSVTGEKSIERVKENENGNPETTTTINITHTWPDEVFNSRVGTKVREWIEGSETKNPNDNVFLTTGNWTNTLKNGDVYQSEIIEPLRREMACKFIVSGIKNISKPDVTGTLDFGDGSCDNKAILKVEGEEDTEITLEKRKRNKKD